MKGEGESEGLGLLELRGTLLGLRDLTAVPFSLHYLPTCVAATVLDRGLLDWLASRKHYLHELHLSEVLNALRGPWHW